MERLAYRPLRHAPRLAPLITAIGVSIILQHLALMIWSRNILAFPQIIPSRTYFIGGAAITTVQIAILAICLTLMASLAILVYRTPLGTAMRATAQNPQVAGLMGIDINRVIAITFVIGAALGAVAGRAVRHLLRHRAVHHGVGARPEGILGGGARRHRQYPRRDARRRAARPGRGARRGLHRRLHRCVPVGLCRSQACEGGGHFILFGSNYQDVFAFMVLILVLVFRPQGLLGERVGDRA